MAPRPVLICGPTASGKSALALALAERDAGLIINADALQVYANWQVLTARPSVGECARVPHRLFGHVARTASYSVGQWLREVEAILDQRPARRLILVGGTGLYMSALTQGLAAIPPVPREIRVESERQLTTRGLASLGGDLSQRDPETWASIDRRNPARVQRAWEVLTATGRGIRSWQRAPAPPLVPLADAVPVVICPRAPALNAAIEGRFAAMLRAGALEEARAELEAGWDPRRPSAKALGAPELIAHLRGELSLDAAMAAAGASTRRYAKRQRTWLRSRMREWNWLVPEPGETIGLLDRIPPS